MEITYNDLDMLQHAAVGIAVANAVDDVKKEADFVTEKNNNQDAVAGDYYKNVKSWLWCSCRKMQWMKELKK